MAQITSVAQTPFQASGRLAKREAAMGRRSCEYPHVLAVAMGTINEMYVKLLRMMFCVRGKKIESLAHEGCPAVAGVLFLRISLRVTFLLKEK